MELYQEYASGATGGERDLYSTQGVPYFKRNAYLLAGYRPEPHELFIPHYESLQLYTRDSDVYVPVSLKFLAFDIDSSSTLEAIIDAKKFITWLELYNVNDYRIYWSGSKGIHITISWSNFGRDYDSYTLRSISTMVSKYVSSLSGVSTFDLSVYNNRSIFRMVNSRNIKTGLYKIEISRDLLFSGDIGSIEILSKSPFNIVPPQNKASDYGSITRLYDLSYDIYQITLDRPTNYTGDGTIEEVDFVEKYISIAHIQPGMRHQVSNVLAAYYRARGLSQEEAYLEIAGFMSKATGTHTPVKQRITEARNDVRTCYSNSVRFSFYKAKELLQ